VTPSGDGDWVKASCSLHNGVVRLLPLFFWYLKGKMLQDISEVERLDHIVLMKVASAPIVSKLLYICIFT
jgi:hypothetical protein